MRYIIMKATILILLVSFLSCSFAEKQPELRPNYENMTKVINISRDILGIEDNVVIKLRPIRSSLRLHTMGFNAVLDAHVDMINDTLYLISVNDLTDKQIVKVMAHEMIHVKQYIDKELVVDMPRVTYKGKLHRDLATLQYNQRKWEQDAEHLGGILAYKIRKVIRETPIDSL